MRVLIVEDEPEVAEALAGGLAGQGIQSVMAGTGRAALDQHASVDAVLLDLGLPDHDGFDVCRAIRAASDVPIIFVSARGDEFDRVLGLKLGADDYVVKPVGLRELAARVEAVVRRAAGVLRQTPPVQPPRGAGPVRVNFHQRRATVHDRDVPLTRKEFDLLALLAGEPGRVYSRDLIMNEVWGHANGGDTRTLGVHMASLRRKLGSPQLIETVRGVGFRMAS